jgi:predicted amidohydrolase
MNIAIVQLSAIKGNIKRNIEKHLKWAGQAKVHNADFVVFPELSLTGYEPELANLLATDQDDKRLDAIQLFCDNNQIAIGAGLPTRKDDNLFISMIIFRPNQKRITYSKQHLYHTEVSVFEPGHNPLVVDFGKDVVAPAICYELSNKEHHAFAIKNKATVYLASVLNSVNGVDADIKKLSEIAKKHKMTAFMSNYIGESGGHWCGGKSSVWNKNGDLIAQLSDKNEGLIVFDTQSEKIVVALNIY